MGSYWISSLTRGLFFNEISLTDSGIQYVTHDALNTIKGLTFDLQNNQIQNLPARVFDRLANLERLLNNNLITSSFPDAFYEK